MSGQGTTKLIPPTFSRDERIRVNNALNEFCNGIHFTDDDFHTRLGASKEEARSVLRRVAEWRGL